MIFHEIFCMNEVQELSECVPGLKYILNNFFKQNSYKNLLFFI